MKPHSRYDERYALAVDRRPAILIVDADRVSERAVELALAPCDYGVEWARDGDAALDIMRQSKTDVVIADSVFSDMSGAILMRRTVDLCGPGAPAFIFVTVDRAVTTRVNLLLAGAADFIIKPFAADELRARVVNTIEARRPRTVATPGLTAIAGDCTYVPLADLLTMLEFGGKSGAIYVSVGVATGRLVIDSGRVVHAEFGALSGGDAFFALLRASGELFRFELGDIDAPHTLNARVSELLLESAVREDTSKHWVGQEALRRTEAGLRELGVVKTPIKLRSRQDAGVPSPSLMPAAQRLSVAIADPFMLGDLILASELPTGSMPQFRIELWAAMPEGVMAMLGLASPPGYRLVIAALQGDRERLHLQFEVATATLVVTLIDSDSDSELPAMSPDGIIVAPPRGDLVALAPQRLAALTSRVIGDESLAVIAVGGPALQATVGRLADRDGPARCLGISSTLEADLRDTLCRLIRLWIAQRGNAD